VGETKTGIYDIKQETQGNMDNEPAQDCKHRETK